MKNPSQIGKYIIEKKIAEGGMGAVYKAKHPTLDRNIILKKMTVKANEQFVQRFKREASLMMDFKNDNIVDVYDHFVDGNDYYIVLEFVDGPSLGDLLQKERYLDDDMALLIFRDACSALAYAHTKEVVHRDIKPANLLLSRKGEVKLVDFGIARQDGGKDDGLTSDGMTLGTPSYMAPEQFNDSRNVDKRADIYSLGVMLYEMVTGRKPFPGGFTPQVINSIQKGKYTNPSTINPQVSGFTRRLIKKCLKRKPSSRFQNIEQILKRLDRYFKSRDLDKISEGIIKTIAGEATSSDERESTKKKHPFRFLASIIIPVLLVAGGLFRAYQKDVFDPILEREKKGAAIIEINMKKAGKEADDLFIQADLFFDDNDEIPKLEQEIFFTPYHGLLGDDFIQLRSNKLSLPAGAYRLKLRFEDTLNWYSFRIAPYRIQRNGNSDNNYFSDTGPERIKLNFITYSERQLLLEPHIVNYFTGDRISSYKIFITEENRWVEWYGGRLKQNSGETVKLKVEAEGYIEQTFILKTDSYDNKLVLRAELIPEESRIKISAENCNPLIKLNDSHYYPEGGLLGKWNEIPEWYQNAVSISVPKGIYRLSAEYKGKSITRKLDLWNDQNSVGIIYDSDQKSLSWREQE